MKSIKVRISSLLPVIKSHGKVNEEGKEKKSPGEKSEYCLQIKARGRLKFHKWHQKR